MDKITLNSNNFSGKKRKNEKSKGKIRKSIDRRRSLSLSKNLELQRDAINTALFNYDKQNRILLQSEKVKINDYKNKKNFFENLSNLPIMNINNNKNEDYVKLDNFVNNNQDNKCLDFGLDEAEFIYISDDN